MIRLTDLTLPLDHAPADLGAAVCERLGIVPGELERVTVVRRGNDARKKTAIKLVYSLDVLVADEPGVLARFAHDHHVRPSPDTSYRFPVMAPAGWAEAPNPAVPSGSGPTLRHACPAATGRPKTNWQPVGPDATSSRSAPR